MFRLAAQAVLALPGMVERPLADLREFRRSQRKAAELQPSREPSMTQSRRCQRLMPLAASARFAGLLVALSLVVGATPASADTIIDEWNTVKAPAPPELKAVTADGKTALLLLDFGKQNCGQRPRCLASVPKVQKMAAEARAKKIFVVLSLPGQATKADLLIAPLDNEPIVTSGANKFLRTELEKILRDNGITTVIVTGTAATWRRPQHGRYRRAVGLQGGPAGRCDVGRPLRGAIHRMASGQRAGRRRAERDRHQDRYGHVLIVPGFPARAG